MTTELVKADGRRGWLDARRKLIGASETPSILGCGYETASDVWLRKIGEAGEQAPTERMEIGEVMQPSIIELARRRLGFEIIDEPANTVRIHHEIPYVGASLDAVVLDGGTDGAPLDAKCVNQFKAKEWNGSAPLGYTVQLQQQMAVTGADHGYLFALIGNDRTAWFRIERNQRFIDAMLVKLAQFWQFVQTKTPPPYQSPIEQAKVLATLYPQDNGQAIRLDDLAANIVARREAMSIAAEVAKTRHLEASNELRAILGDNAYGALPDGRWVSYRTIHCPAYTVEAKSYRRLWIHDKRPKDAPALGYEPQVVEALEFDETTIEPDHIDRATEAEAALLRIGAVSRYVSTSGSRYLVLPGGANVRIADHDPNEKTRDWMERQTVFSVRIDRETWRDELEVITGPIFQE